MGSVRIAVISDERFLHDSLSRILTNVSSIVVVALNTSQAPERAIRDAGLDVAVIDYGTKEALDICRAIVRTSGPAVLLLRVPDDDDDRAAVEALSAGAGGIVYTSSPVDDAISAIEAVSNGQLWAASHVVERWAADHYAGWNAWRDAASFDQRLSDRELEVLQHAAAGLANKEVAARLAICESTVKVHLTHIFRKLGVHSRTELAAAYHGLRPFTARQIFSGPKSIV